MLAFLSVGLLVHRTATDRDISRTTKWIAMKGATDVHSPHRMNAAGFGDSQTFLVPLPAGGQRFFYGFWGKI